MAPIKHGHCTGGRISSEYHSWAAMIKRCENPSCDSYPDYGGRGIKVYDPWHDFATFFRDMGSKPSPGLKIERRDNDGDYTPDNCYWGTNEEQANNTRKSLRLTLDGVTMTAAQWARKLGIKHGTISNRKLRGYPDHLCLSTTSLRKMGY